MGIVIIDISITKRSSGGQVPANPNRNHLTHLVKQVIELRIGDILIEISNIKRRRHELVGPTIGGSSVSSGNRILRLNLNLGHLKNQSTQHNTTQSLDFFFFQNFFKFLIFFFAFLPSPLVIQNQTLGRTQKTILKIIKNLDSQTHTNCSIK